MKPAFAILATLLAACKGADTSFGDTDTDTPVDTDVADTDVHDTGFNPDPDCTDYEPWTDRVMSCGGSYTTVWKMVSLSDPYGSTCPPYYATLGYAGTSYETFSAAATALQCDTSCVYSSFEAAMGLWCGSRGEYTIYASGAEGQTGPGDQCPDLIWGDMCTGSAWASSIEEYQAAFLCDQHTDTCPNQ